MDGYQIQKQIIFRLFLTTKSFYKNFILLNYYIDVYMVEVLKIQREHESPRGQ